MRAVTVRSAGEPDVMTLEQVDEPVAAPGELLVDVVATAVNRADVMQRRGFYPPPPGASPYLGLECSGRVAALGPGVTGWRPGDEVCCLLAGGGYAERVAVPVEQVLPVPTGVDLVAAAALPEVTCTVWANVFQLCRLGAGDVLLAHGGSSGIGTMAIQLAHVHGARVAVTAGSADKLARCQSLGADVLIDYREQDFVAELETATDGHGADVILDNMGGKYLARNVDALAVDGRLVVIGLQGGRRAELDLGKLMAKRGALFGTSLRSRPVAQKAAVVAGVREHVWPLLAEGRVRPVVDSVWPLADVVEAHRLMESSRHVGKVLLAVQP